MAPVCEVVVTRADADKCPFANDVAFALSRGDVVWLQGPSGVGKTTVAGEVAGLGGASVTRRLGFAVEVTWDAAVPPRERCGAMFQQTTLIDALSVGGNVARAGGARRRGARRGETARRGRGPGLGARRAEDAPGALGWHGAPRVARVAARAAEARRGPRRAVHGVGRSRGARRRRGARFAEIQTRRGAPPRLAPAVAGQARRRATDRRRATARFQERARAAAALVFRRRARRGRARILVPRARQDARLRASPGA
mmetsp:Transcript_33855/g.104831  ORF Transcript_33855/g.104831 Transcript_33855/m.104831 type:complete len:255 (+) Transcript_33855:129-893(+)